MKKCDPSYIARVDDLGRIQEFFDTSREEIIESLFDYCFGRLGPEKAKQRFDKIMLELAAQALNGISKT